jgi:hypothetical protein
MNTTAEKVVIKFWLLLQISKKLTKVNSDQICEKLPTLVTLSFCNLWRQRSSPACEDLTKVQTLLFARTDFDDQHKLQI